MTKVLVVGGGIAGYCAALAARRDGAEVTVVAKAPGATALYAGGMEVVDDLDAILAHEPHHPITRLGLDSVRLASELDTAIHTLQLALEKDGLKFEGTWRARGLYSDIHGLARPANLVPATVSSGELRALIGRRVAVVGVREVGDYDAESTAQALKELHGIEAVPEEVSIADLPLASSLTDLYGRRAPQLAHSRATAIAYPPGFTNLPHGGFEMLSAPPSPHGWRLQQAIALGMQRADVMSFESARGRITSALAGDRTIRADAFVLATGMHIGGGLLGGHPAAKLLSRIQVLQVLQPRAHARNRPAVVEHAKLEQRLSCRVPT